MDQKHSASAHQAEARSTARIYTKPELHERLKDELMASDRGGRPGEWSPRKAQLLTHEYRQAGGGYTFAKRSHHTPHAPASPAAEQPAEQHENGSRPPQQAWTDFASTSRPAADDKQRGHTRADQLPAAGPTQAHQNSQPATDEE